LLLWRSVVVVEECCCRGGRSIIYIMARDVNKKGEPQQGYFNLPSYLLSRFAFLGTHAVFTYWLLFILNDPFNFGVNTLDFKEIKPADQCTPIITQNVIFDLALFALWWGTHSVLARDVYKKALGIFEHPIERPLFAAIATIAWGINVVFWKPISDCERWYPLETPILTWIFSGTIIALATALIVGFLWILPDHVFGTAKYQYPQGKFPKHELLGGFPYGLVRHPAATGFLWAYWAFPSHTTNHVFLASLWTVFIVVGTLVFEEGGLKSRDGFGKEYSSYRSEVPAFYPSINGVKELLGMKKPARPGVGTNNAIAQKIKKARAARTN